MRRHTSILTIPTATKTQWLCDFEQLDLKQREAENTVADHNYRVTAGVLFTPTFPNPPSLRLLTKIQGRVREGLARLREGQRWRYKVARVEVFLVPGKGGLAQGGGVRPGWTRAQGEVFILEAMRVLAEARDRLRVCRHAGCGRLIYAVKRQVYCRDCSAKFAEKERIARWRERHRDKVNKWARDRRRKRKQPRAQRPFKGAWTK